MKLAKIDGYSTYRATGLRSRFEGPIWGVFRVTGDRMLFVTGTKGGVYRKKAWGCTGPTFLEVFCFLWFVPTNRLPAC